MAIDTTRAFADALRKMPLLTTAQQAEFSRDLQAGTADVRVLARRLLERGWVTSFQVNQLILGRGADLVVGAYLLLERIGEGGTGQVYKARHLHMNRIVAFKLIRQDLLSDREVVARFHREVQLASSLTDPHVVHAYDAGPIGGNYYLAMEYLEGTDLARLVQRQGPLPIELACEYIRQAADGLQHIHERGLVHRDVKPSNLLVTPAGVVKILDLGLARLQRPTNGEMTGNLTTANPVTMGTLDYMAPEQALDFHGADCRADVYSLGCTFYYLLAGRPPFPDGTLAQKLLRHQQAEPTPLGDVRRDVPAPVVTVVRRMMAKRPADRFQIPGEVAQALTGGGIPASPRSYLPVPANGVRSLLPVPVAVPAGALVPSRTSRVRKVVPILSSLSHTTMRLMSPRRRRWPLVAVGTGAALLGLLVLVVVLRSGSLAAPTRTAAASTPAPATVAVPVPALAYLSDLKEQNFQGQAFGNNGHLNHNGNGNLGGNVAEARIIVKGVLSRKGLSTLAPSQGAAQVTYRLGRQYANFKSGVALHDGGWFSGSKVTFTVLGDGKVLWQSKVIAAHSDYPQECSVSVAGVDLLELQVTCTSSNNGVWPVWIDPAFTK